MIACFGEKVVGEVMDPTTRIMLENCRALALRVRELCPLSAESVNEC